MSIEQEDRYHRARAHVAALKKFYLKIIRSVIFVGLLAGLNYYLNGLERPWFLWIALFVGIGLFIEGIKQFGLSLFLGHDWEDRKVKEMMDKENQTSERVNRWE